MARERSEYLAAITGLTWPPAPGARRVADTDRDALATLLLAAYRGTIDDEGEDLDDAYDAIDDYARRIVREHSVVLDAGAAEGGGLVAMSFVVELRGRHYIDPVAVAPHHKRRGTGRAIVAASLASLRTAGVTEVGATITDGNEPSERLFAGLGFRRIGAQR